MCFEAPGRLLGALDALREPKSEAQKLGPGEGCAPEGTKWTPKWMDRATSKSGCPVHPPIGPHLNPLRAPGGAGRHTLRAKATFLQENAIRMPKTARWSPGVPRKTPEKLQKSSREADSVSGVFLEFSGPRKMRS